MSQRCYFQDAAEVADGLKQLNERFSGKSILLTGAAGFLGVQFTHYFAALNDSGHLAKLCRLVAMDSFLRGRPAWVNKLAGRKDIEFRQVDIVRQREFEHFDYIIHAASVASPIFYRQYPIETMDANVTGLRNLLDHAVTKRVAGFLFFSTSEIYGDPDSANVPTKETYRGNVSCTGPRACYDESKRFGETLCVNFQKAHQVPVVSVRPFNNYGPGLKILDRRVLPDFFRDVLAGRDIVLLSDGRATRTFCYVADAIEGYLRAMLLGTPGEAYNIGTEKPEISMAELAEAVIRTTQAKVKVVRHMSEDKDYLTDNPQRRCPDITKARLQLGYNPRIGLDEGLHRMHAFYMDNPNE